VQSWSCFHGSCMFYQKSYDIVMPYTAADKSVWTPLYAMFLKFHTSHEQLENVAINDVLPLKATCLNAIANIKCFWGH